MADWEEIKRLAADFQRAQTSDTLQRLSDRNCIDIVKKLTELNLIELIYTCDGKEFITPAHLLREIEDEIYVNGGRMHLHDLATNLNVDYQHIENKARELVDEKSEEYSLILGQIIHTKYKFTLSRQINDCMSTTGQLSIADFAKNLDLPSDFLLSVVKEILPKLPIKYVPSQDERTFYTACMMDRYKSIIAGTLSAIIRPTTLTSIMKRLDIPERIFIPIVEGFTKDGRLDASIENRVFLPSIYARKQNEWIDKFYLSNSYIDYDILARKDIKQPKAFLKKRFPEGIQLKTCFVSPTLASQVESLIEECISSNSCIEIGSAVSSALEPDDIELLFQDILKKNKQFGSSCFLFNHTSVCSLGFIAACKESFNSLMPTKAQEHLKDGKLVNHFLGGKLREFPKEKENKGNVEDSNIEENKVKQKEELSKDITEDETIQQLKVSKKEQKDKKNKMDANDEDSDDEVSRQKSKKKKSGGGAQGREIKQKAVKKKYNPGSKVNQKINEESDDDTSNAKVSRSSKGRAAKRAITPERPIQNSSKCQPAKPQPREPLIFMTTEEIVTQLQTLNRGSDEFSNDVYESIAQLIEVELNLVYKDVAKLILDDYLRSCENEPESDTKPKLPIDGENSEDIDLVN